MDIDNRKYNIIIPETIIDKELWYTKLEEFMKNNFSLKNVYYIKHRLKTPLNLKKFNDYFSKYRKYENIRLIYDPFFFTTVKLFQNSNEIIFFSPNSNVIRESIGSGLKATYYFSNDEYNKSKREIRLKRTYLDYHEFPKKAFENIITLYPSNSEYFLKRIKDTII